jgi:hypothetical protein
MTEATTWGPGIPRCARCEREAVTADDRDRLLCARHALIFMTAKRIAATSEERRKSA